MKRVLLKISYDGTAYHGWQVQPNAVTVQQVLQDSLQKVIKVRPDVCGCSRTDAGVHAREFYCHFDCDENLPDSAFLLGLNSVLPNDIAVTGCKRVGNDFHARYDSKGKNYIYRMYWGTPDPFLSRYALKLEREPDITLMNEFCKTLMGEHDFIGFSSSGRTVEGTVRTVSECAAKINENVLEFSISANGFLYNMVRILAGTALEASYGRLDTNCAAEVFKTGDRALAGPTLPPQGLFLNKVFY